jgi:MoaA/NifB/PqqE/SkfB family radical SAM enzyme
MYKYEEVKVVHLEVTQRCQAACPMCDRNENGGVDNRHLTDADLSLDDCKKIFQPDFIQQLDTMYMCGNLGDPIMAKDTLAIFEYFRAINPQMWLSMNTNGGAQPVSWWQQLAKVLGRHGTVIFSVDGLADTNHIYRQNVIWANIERNMKAFIAAGGRARWDFIVFAHNEHQIDTAKALASEWGVERFQLKKSGRFFTVGDTVKTAHQSQNRRGQATALIQQPTQIENQNMALLKQAEIEKTYGSMRSYYDSCKINCKVAAERSIFITAEGLLMPCCWTAGRMYKWWQLNPKVEQIWDHIDAAGGKDRINVIVNTLKEVMAGPLLPGIESSWNKPSLSEGKLGVCAMKCGTEFDQFKEQYR